MVLVDTSVWIDVFRDKSGAKRNALSTALAGDEVVLSRFNQLELLQGCREEKEWTLLNSYLDAQDYLELLADSWREAARTYFDLRRMGRTVRSPIDCCIAQVAIDHDVMLLHCDQDFETIASIRPLRQANLKW
jgi:predicted nucleic acid-binding protein